MLGTKSSDLLRHVCIWVPRKANFQRVLYLYHGYPSSLSTSRSHSCVHLRVACHYSEFSIVHWSISPCRTHASRSNSASKSSNPSGDLYATCHFFGRAELRLEHSDHAPLYAPIGLRAVVSTSIDAFGLRGPQQLDFLRAHWTRHLILASWSTSL